MIEAILSRVVRRKKPAAQEDDLCPVEYDMRELNDRMYKAMGRLGKTRVDIAKLYGMDPNIPLVLQPVEKIPRPNMGNVAKLAGYMGVSVRWLLHGEPENDVDLFVMGHQAVQGHGNGASAAQGGAIISGAQNSTVVVQHINGGELNNLEREMIHSFRTLSARDQTAVMSYVFALEKENAGKKNNPPA